MATYLFKTEPSEFSFDDLAKAGPSLWDGVKNPQALIHLRAIKTGDEVLIYHTGDERAIVGLARAESGPVEDPKNPGQNDRGEPRFAVVKLRALGRFPSPVELTRIKADARFADFGLIRQGRLSVMPVPAALDRILRSWAGEPIPVRWPGPDGSRGSEKPMPFKKTSRSSRPALCISAMTLLALAGQARAQDAMATGSESVVLDAIRTPTRTPATIDPPRESEREMPVKEQPRLRGSLTFDWVSAYFTSGLNQEDSGMIVQPALRLDFTLWAGEDARVALVGGTWNSIHAKRTLAEVENKTIRHWYETDVFGGAVLELGPVTWETIYQVYYSPARAFETSQEIITSLALDDSEWLGDFALSPYIEFAFEIGSNYSEGPTFRRGVLFETGLEPGLDVTEAKDDGTQAWRLSLPMALGLSVHEYYEDAEGKDRPFGFFELGPKLTIPLSKAEDGVQWSINGGVKVLFLGKTPKALNLNRGTAVVGYAGVQMDF
jgi:predicted RNA-binding protein with PUA-like domain